MWAADVPVFALAVRRQDECALPCSHQHPHVAHLSLSRGFPKCSPSHVDRAEPSFSHTRGGQRNPNISGRVAANSEPNSHSQPINRRTSDLRFGQTLMTNHALRTAIIATNRVRPD